MADHHVDRHIAQSSTPWQGRIISIVEDSVELAEGKAPVTRQYTRHPGAVAIVAMRGDDGSEEVLVELQYRHPVKALLWEIPAGLLDIANEDPLVAAKRELAEEADLQAARWDVLVDFFNSPGGSDESLRVFLARDLGPTNEVFDREDEEADLELRWVPLDEAVAAIMDGRIHNTSAVVGLLAAYRARADKWENLRAADAPWFR
ncbi:MAG: NUDIX hydrolase [Actinomycetaceae bacterium]|nr:NUDIX hydrolase [Actinomycetaceae bacterium]